MKKKSWPWLCRWVRHDWAKCFWDDAGRLVSFCVRPGCDATTKDCKK